MNRRRDRSKKNLHQKVLSKKLPKANAESKTSKSKTPPANTVIEVLQDEVSLSASDLPPSPMMEISSHETEGASVEEVPSPIVVDISEEENSMEVEIKIVQETTPIYKQHTMFVSYWSLIVSIVQMTHRKRSHFNNVLYTRTVDLTFMFKVEKQAD